MTEPNLLPVLYTRLAVSGCDSVRMHDLANWYEAQGQSQAAACVRWACENNLRPFCYSRQAPLRQHSAVWHPGWYWWANSRPLENDWGHPTECRLPSELWDQLRHTLPFSPVVFKEYATLQLAFEALIDAWARLASPARPVPERSVLAPSVAS